MGLGLRRPNVLDVGPMEKTTSPQRHLPTVALPKTCTFANVGPTYTLAGSFPLVPPHPLLITSMQGKGVFGTRDHCLQTKAEYYLTEPVVNIHILTGNDEVTSVRYVYSPEGL